MFMSSMIRFITRKELRLRGFVRHVGRTRLVSGGDFGLKLEQKGMQYRSELRDITRALGPTRFCGYVSAPQPEEGRERWNDSESHTKSKAPPMSLPNQFYPKDTPFGKLSCEEAFKGLEPQEKRYAHFMSRACWYGHFIAFHRTSPEAPLIFIFLDKVLRSKPTLDGVTTNLKEQFSFTDDDVKAFLVYCGAFFSAAGNYRDFGDTKFLPEVPMNKMQTVLRSLFPEDQDFWAEHCLEPMYDYKESVRNLGFPPHGINSYWSSNCNETDAAIVTQYLTEKRLDAYNQRTFKEVVDGKTSYEIRVASRQLSNETDTTAEKLLSLDEDRNGIQFRVRRGDYSSLLGDVIESLESASNEAANENQRNMLREYVKSFETGSIQAHKDGSRSWVMDKGPAVETYIGFIENYRDPAGARADFEGFVAVVNREGSKRLGVLVEEAEAVIKESMPWPRAFEKDSYLKPDFTALDVISFAGCGVPIGIIIPNYNEVRQNEGFKNVHLENAIKAQMSAAEIDFVTKTDAELLKKYRDAALGVQVGLHELLGHGTGKLFEKDPVKGANFDVSTVNPLTGKPVETWYTAGQRYDSQFGNMSSTYEECRAEAIGIYLCLERH
ncbi:dipeptidyl peptidase 3, partial [Galendromus occidentalis]|uniref:Dipeptidyl peptidase 3 n=1 Tax=Galendromus occidentalis TaxID=34638 RepID=A0AAJ6VVM2_9ACAR